ncbi:MAG TPA: hypothetical protein VMX13_05305 [Sedimentisphaerales bacterium]|nr:hypothetical protein [Sedimentisphaerales bacterium]
MGNVVIVTGMSGVKPKRVLEKFSRYLQKKGKDHLCVIDLEDLLVGEAFNDAIYAGSSEFRKSSDEGEEPIISVTSLPYPMLNRLWANAIEKAGEEVRKATEAGRNVALVLHAVYFKADSTEFVPIVDAEKLRTLNPKYVVHLVDDIYDMYAWLRGEGGIFDEYTSPGDEFKQVKKSIQDLISTLIWRQAEAGASAHLAGLLGSVPVLTVATKHRCGLLQKIFEGNILPVYLSHPISEPRRVRSEGNNKLFDDWSNWVSSLADHLSGELAVWEPTTIDEWMIPSVEVKAPPSTAGQRADVGQENSINGNDKSKKIKVYIPRLLERWPLGRVDEVLWSKPEKPLKEPLDPAGFFTDEEVRLIQKAMTWQEIKDKLGEKKSLELCCISGELEHLVALIGEQINSRDRTLVRQCSSLVIYRPLFNGNSAGGVLKELQAHKGFTELQHYTNAPKVFVLENSEDEKLLWRNTVVELLCGNERPWWGSFVSSAKEGGISRLKSIQIADFVTQDKLGELSSTKVVERMDEAAKELEFQWGEKQPGVLTGMGKGARRKFCATRARELETAFTEQIEYRTVLAEYDDSMVYRDKDIDVTAFAKKVVDILKAK